MSEMTKMAIKQALFEIDAAKDFIYELHRDTFATDGTPANSMSKRINAARAWLMAMQAEN